MSLRRLAHIEPHRVKEQFARSTTLAPQEFYLPFPPSTNKLTKNNKNGGRSATREVEQWVRDAGMELNGQKPLSYNVPVEIWVYLEDTHPSADCSNFFKKIEDLLVDHGIIKDDKAKYVRSAHQVWSPETKGCRVSIRPAPLHGGEA